MRDPHLGVRCLENEMLARRRVEDIRVPFVQVLPCFGHELTEMNVLAVGPEGHKRRKSSLAIRPKNIGSQHRSVAHRHRDVFVQKHRVPAWRGTGSHRPPPNCMSGNAESPPAIPAVSFEKRCQPRTTTRRDLMRRLVFLIALIIERAHHQVKTARGLRYPFRWDRMQVSAETLAHRSRPGASNPAGGSKG